MDATFQWFTQRGITLSKAGSDREYLGSVDGVEGVELVLLPAAEIPRELATGRIDLGVTGTDLIHETLVDPDHKVAPVQEMGFGRADLVLAVPACWVDVTTLHDLDAVAARFRQGHGFRLRIATKYHRLTHDFLTGAGIADYQLVDSQGATEGVVKNQTAEAIADITTTGATLRANHLRTIEDGLILTSQATLWRSKGTGQDLTPILGRVMGAAR